MFFFISSCQVSCQGFDFLDAVVQELHSNEGLFAHEDSLVVLALLEEGLGEVVSRQDGERGFPPEGCFPERKSLVEMLEGLGFVPLPRGGERGPIRPVVHGELVQPH